MDPFASNSFSSRTQETKRFHLGGALWIVLPFLRSKAKRENMNSSESESWNLEFRSLIRWSNSSKTEYPITFRPYSKGRALATPIKKGKKSSLSVGPKKRTSKSVHFELVEDHPSRSLDADKAETNEEREERNKVQSFRSSSDLPSATLDETLNETLINDEEDGEDDEEEEEEGEEEQEESNQRGNLGSSKATKPNIGYTKIKMVTPCPLLSEDDHLPQICFPTEYSVPNHLMEELSEMMKASPDFAKKSRLVPKENLSVKALQVSLMMKNYWTLEKIEYLCKILMKKFKSTLSNIDWLCTNYSQEIPVKYLIDKEKGTEMFDLFASHKTNLDLWTRRYFGVFCRHNRILIAFRSKELERYLYPESKDGSVHWIKKLILGTRMVKGTVWFYLITSICQLKFFEWAINKKVIDYCESHSTQIDAHMKETKKKPKDSGKRRRLCQAAPPQAQVHDTILEFTRDINNRISSELVEDQEEERGIPSFSIMQSPLLSERSQ